tara:strand:+ start:400 stop:894 length:495 start_codon:yes stop_codon:yes gene_type:complete
MSITLEQREKSEEFINALNELLDFVEEVVPHVKENEYLKACNNLKTLSELRNKPIMEYVERVIHVVRSNDIVSQHNNRTKMKIKPEHVPLLDAEKLKKGWKCCKNCDRLVKNLQIHMESDVCRRTSQSKKITVKTNITQNNDMIILIHKIRAWAIKTHRYKYYK